MIFHGMIDVVALVWFGTSWAGYTLYAKHAARKGTRTSLSSVLFAHRVSWMTNMIRHEARISDIALVGNLSNMVNFLATTTLFILAGVVTVICNTDNMIKLLEDHAFIAATSVEAVQFKLILIALVFVFAFFKFTWSMRQHTFCNIIIGALPHVGKDEALTPAQEEAARCVAKISDRAGHEFNYGLRSYYFAVALLTWFINAWMFMAFTACVVGVLYRREFSSATLRHMIKARAAIGPTSSP